MNRNDYMTISGADYIRAMFANTEADGTLTLESEPEDSATWHMDWREENAETIAAEYEVLNAALTRLGKEHDRWEKSTEGMPEDLLEFWNTYILPYPSHDLDKDKLFFASILIFFLERASFP